jgi:glycosyltransferase involved in cell wall biosynthesis
MNIKSKILHCSVVHSIDDSRIFYKECVSLVNFGYNVSYIAKSSVNLNFNNSTYLGVNIHILKNNQRIINNFKVFKKALKFNIIHFHDPELIIIGLLLKLFGKKVIYDVHENYRQTIFYKTNINNNFKWMLIKGIIFFEFLANNLFDAIVVVTPNIKHLFTNNRTVLVRNFPVLTPVIKAFDFPEKNIVIYIGSLSEKRGIIEIIKATKYFRNNTELWIAGQWSDIKFQKICENLNEYNNIKYLGHLNHEAISKILSISTIGICLLHPTQSYINRGVSDIMILCRFL